MNAPINLNDERLRRHIAALENMQERRRALIAKRRRDEQKLLDRYQREIDNLKTQLTIGVDA